MNNDERRVEIREPIWTIEIKTVSTNLKKSADKDKDTLYCVLIKRKKNNICKYVYIFRNKTVFTL